MLIAPRLIQGNGGMTAAVTLGVVVGASVRNDGRPERRCWRSRHSRPTTALGLLVDPLLPPYICTRSARWVTMRCRLVSCSYRSPSALACCLAASQPLWLSVWFGNQCFFWVGRLWRWAGADDPYARRCALLGRPAASDRPSWQWRRTGVSGFVNPAMSEAASNEAGLMWGSSTRAGESVGRSCRRGRYALERAYRSDVPSRAATCCGRSTGHSRPL